MESLKDRFIRGDLARAVVESGWNLNELRPAAMSLEEIFLQLTGGPMQSRRAASRQKRLRKERSNEKYLDHLPKRTAQLFRLARGLSAADDVRRDFRVLLLELGGLFQSRPVCSRR